MIAEIWDVLAGKVPGGFSGPAFVGTGVAIAPWFRSRTKVDQSRLDQVERLAEINKLSEYRYPPKDLAGLVQCAREAGLITRLHISGSSTTPPDPVRTAGYQILEEALINVLKHGDGVANVFTHYETNRFALTVDNPVDGKPPEASGPRRGLKFMRRCANDAGGSFSVGPHGNGWRVHAAFPIKRTSWGTVRG
jgi:hypothetical protein